MSKSKCVLVSLLHPIKSIRSWFTRFIDRRIDSRLHKEQQLRFFNLQQAIESWSGIWAVTRKADGAVFLIHGPMLMHDALNCVPEEWRNECEIARVYGVFDEKMIKDQNHNLLRTIRRG